MTYVMLDYCNALLSGITAHQLQRLQRIQNWDAMMIALRKFFKTFTGSPKIWDYHINLCYISTSLLMVIHHHIWLKCLGWRKDKFNWDNLMTNCNSWFPVPWDLVLEQHSVWVDPNYGMPSLSIWEMFHRWTVLKKNLKTYLLKSYYFSWIL